MLKSKKVLALLLSVSFMAELALGNVMTVSAAEGNTLTIGEGSVATGEYAEWKNTAITYPAKGQLVAAGDTIVLFNQLEDAVKYEVYVDDKLMKTIEGEAADAESFEVEYRNVEVAKHATYVVATLQDGAKVTSNIRNFYISKKGLGIWQSETDMLKELNCAWYYNWSPYELEGVNEQIEYVPMIGGAEDDPRPEHTWSRNEEWKWLREGNYKNYRYLLAFNEPDLTGQAEMTPERAVELWDAFEAISDEGIIVGSPAVASPMSYFNTEDNSYGVVGGWFGKYGQLMAEAEYHYDFTAVHIYLDWTSEQILDILEDIYEMTGKPIWITEWGIAGGIGFDWAGGADGSWQRNNVVQFMEDYIPVIDELDYVERYAWFPFDGLDEVNGAGGLFFSEEIEGEADRLTAAGDQYKVLGNPEGWNPDAVTQDNVVIDDLQNDSEDPVEGNPFADVKVDDWFYKYAKFAYDSGLITGKGTAEDGKAMFDPGKEMTRAEFVQVLYSKEGKPAVEYKATFTDVPEGAWYANAVLWANENGIVVGKGESFAVSENITREEMAAILYKYAQYKNYDVESATELTSFVDEESISSWAVTGMKWAVAKGVISGKNAESGLALAPQGNAIRAEAATMLRSFMVAYEGVENE